MCHSATTQVLLRKKNYSASENFVKETTWIFLPGSIHYRCPNTLLIKCKICINKVTALSMDGSPGLVVMRGDSRSGGCGFESQCRLLDGHFFTLIWCKLYWLFLWKRLKINEKETGDGPFFKKKQKLFLGKSARKYF